VVKNGKIVGEGYNNVISHNDPTWWVTSDVSYVSSHVALLAARQLPAYQNHLSIPLVLKQCTAACMHQTKLDITCA
jgi:tRNA(Arg) A34 adenosine deaminase TadA